MKHLKLILSVTVVASLIYGCDKNNDTDKLKVGQITMVIDGKNYKSASIDNFESLSDTNDWNIYPGGELSIDTVNKLNGKSSIKLISSDQCFHVEKIEGIPVELNRNYVIHFHYKLPVTTLEELNNGLSWTCMGPFRLELKQGNEVILSEWLDEIDNWTEKYFYFQPINNVPVKLDLLIGTRKGVSLDDLITLEEY